MVVGGNSHLGRLGWDPVRAKDRELATGRFLSILACMSHQPTSRRRYQEYKRELQESRNRKDPPGHGHTHRKSDSPPKPRERTAWELIRAFFGLLRPYSGTMIFALATLSIATALALIPPAATKFVVDYVLDDQPLPESVPAWVPRERWPLLVTLTVSVFAISMLKLGFHIWGRWHATRVTKLVQMSVRKRVTDQAIRLPLHRVQELKSGGAASILRQDAGSVGDLVFGMLYNPWRAVIQLIGSMLVLAFVDWRLLLGAIVLAPVVYLTHRTWINRIRPQFRRVRAQREEVDALATESFGGMRVVRAFSRQRAETNRIMRGNHLMGRQELHAWWWMRSVEMVWETFIPLASACLMLYGGWQVVQGRLTLGDLTMFLVYLLMLLGPLATLAQSAATFQNSLSGFDRVLDLLAEPRELATDGPTVVVNESTFRGHIVFDQVSFCYPNAGKRGVARCESGDRSGGDGGIGWRQRRRQNDVMQSGGPLLRSHGRRNPLGWPRLAGDSTGKLPPVDRDRRTGRVPVRRHRR